jgi:hypothetical protein
MVGVKRFNDSTIQRFNDSTIQRFNDSTAFRLVWPQHVTVMLNMTDAINGFASPGPLTFNLTH